MSSFASCLSVLVVAAALLFSVGAAGFSAEVSLEWVVVSNPGPGFDVPTGVCVWGNTVLVVGSEELPDERGPRVVGRVEARSLRDGSLLAARSIDPRSEEADFDTLWLYSCAASDGVLFAVGTSFGEGARRLYVLSMNVEDLSILSSAHSEHDTMGVSVVASGDYVFVLSMARTKDDDLLWLVEKRRASDLELVASYTYDPSPGRVVSRGNIPCCIEQHPLTGEIWVAGYSDTKVSWILLVLSEDLELLAEIDVPMGYYAGSLCFDSRGSAYVAGMRGLASLDPAKRFAGKRETPATVRSVGIACGNGLLYVLSVVWRERERLFDFSLYVYGEDFTVLGVVPLNVSTTRHFVTHPVRLLGDLLVVSMPQDVRPEGLRPGYPDTGWVLAALRILKPEASPRPEMRPETRTTPELIPPPPAEAPAWFAYAAGAGVATLLVVALLLLRKPGRQ